MDPSDGIPTAAAAGVVRYTKMHHWYHVVVIVTLSMGVIPSATSASAISGLKLYGLSSSSSPKPGIPLQSEKPELFIKDQCAQISQVQGSMIQILTTHYEYGKGIHRLHNIVDNLQKDVLTLKTKLLDMEEKQADFNGDDEPPPKKGNGTSPAGNAGSPRQQPKYLIDNTLSEPVGFHRYKVTAHRSIQNLQLAVANLTAHLANQTQRYTSLEKRYRSLRRRVKKASVVLEDWSRLTQVEQRKSAEEEHTLHHFLQKQREINGNVLQRIQYLEETWKRRVASHQGDSPYDYLPKHNGGCPQQFVQHYTSCYKFVNLTLDWVDAEKHCQGLHPDAHLVSIESKEESEYLIKYRVHNLATWSSNYIWTGGNDMSQESTWKWVGTGRELTFANWRPGEPNNHNDDQHCVYLRADGADSRWDDWHCHAARLNFVCEITLHS